MKKKVLIITFLLVSLFGKAQIDCITNYSGTFSNSSDPRNYIEYQGWLYFAGSSDGTGTELWRTNGNGGVTELFADIGILNYSGSPADFVIYQSELYFTANNQIDGIQIWKTNGTVNGTVAVTTFTYPENVSNTTGVSGLIVFNNHIFFSRTSAANGGELWKTDGTEAGTSMVKDINPGAGSSIMTVSLEAKILGSNLYFFADDGIHGGELWKSDGTETGTTLVKDINVGSNQSYGESLTICNNILYFVAFDAINGSEIWKSDGTSVGTLLLVDIYPGVGGANPEYLTVSNNQVFFSAFNTTYHKELWRTDGTSLGTYLVKDICPGSCPGEPTYLTDANGTLYFAANNSVNGNELWKSDGTTIGTVLVKDIRSGGSSDPKNFYFYNGYTYFQASDGNVGQELWRTDGSNVGTTLVANINPSSFGSLPSNFICFDSTLVFNATTSTTSNYEPWITDGTSVGTTNLRNIYTADNLNDVADDGEIFKNKLYFDAVGIGGRQLYSSSGTLASTGLFANIGSGYPEEYYVINNRMYFHGESGIYRTNGTVTGTTMLTTTNFPTVSPYIHGTLNGKFVYFINNISTSVVMLYICDSTSSPQLVKSISNADIYDSYNPFECVTMNNVLYFSMETSSAGRELWRSDGTSSGTYLLKNIASGSADGDPKHLTVFDNKLYFSANDGINGNELWQSDGTAAGTLLFGNIQPFSASSSPKEFKVFNDTLYFSADDGINGRELWQSDGTVSGTSLYVDLFPGSGSSNPMNPTSVFNGLYFSAFTENEGREMWVKKINANPELLIDLGPGKFSGNPSNLKVIDNLLYFCANDEIHGYEPYVTLGSECSTSIIQDLNPGDKGSFPLFFGKANGKILLRAETDLNNTEIHSFDAPFQNTDTVLACQEYYWPIIDDTLLTSGYYSQIIASNSGCDSIVNLNLIIGTPTTTVDHVTSCSSYTWIDGVQYNTSNTTATHVLTSSTGCDSTVTLDLVINYESTSSDSVTTCSSYYWETGDTTYTESGFYSRVLTNAGGCDSLVTLNLTILTESSSNTIVSACNMYLWPTNNVLYTTGGTYTAHLFNSQGCDSVVTLYLSILSNSSIDSVTSCVAYTWIDGNTYENSTNTPTMVFSNTAGCDSIVTLHLNILSNNTTDHQTGCDSYTWIDGNTYYASTNSPTWTFTNVNGCDSVVTLHLTINNNISVIDIQSACGSYTWIDGNTYTSSTNSPIWAIISTNGCDSTITLNLTINPIPNATAMDSGDATITAGGIGNYQWINCSNNSEINGATSETFAPTANGTYAVVVDNGNCSDTSNCVTISNIGLEDADGLKLSIAPNPTTDMVTILFEGNNAELIVYDTQGKLIQTSNIISGTQVSLKNVQTGVYFFEITTNEGKAVKRVVKN